MMVITHFLKHKNLLIKSLLLAAAMLASQATQATCFAIDEHIMVNGRKVICFGDFHIDSLDEAEVEQDNLIKIAKKRGAYCIVEDSFSYDGNDLHVRNYIDKILYNDLMSDSRNSAKYQITSLSGLARKCAAAGIECHNAETRFALQSDSIRSDEMIQEIEGAFDEVRQSPDMNKETLNILRGKCDCAIAAIRHNISTGIYEALGLINELFELKLIAHIEQLLANEEDQRDIFIFAGFEHGNTVNKYLQNKYHSHKNSNTMYDQVYPSFNDDVTTAVYFEKDQSPEFLSNLVSKYRIDVKKYFEPTQQQQDDQKDESVSDEASGESQPQKKHAARRQIVQELAQEVRKRTSNSEQTPERDGYLEFYEYHK